jgi:hypothetical protein
MKKHLFKKFNANAKKSGQALLIVVVVSTLSLLVLLSMSDRVSLARVNLQRNAEFNQAINTAENKLNSLITVLDKNDATTAGCLTPIDSATYKEVTCTALQDQLTNNLQGSKIYGRVSPDGFVSVNNSQPLTLVLGTSLTVGEDTTGLLARCQGSTTAKFMITRVYYDSVTQKLLVDKGVYQCTASAVPSCLGNVTLYSTNTGVPVQVAGSGAAVTHRAQTILVRARIMDEGVTNVKLDLKAYGGASCGLQASTSKYQFIVSGLGSADQGFVGFGSDALLTFEKSGDSNAPWSPTVFDYVFLGEDN